MQAIQTSYKGYLFRSRLEARWAVFFDELKLDWQYEVEGFQLDDGTMYLPDFKISIHVAKALAYLSPDMLSRLKDFDFYIEVKPRNIIMDEKFEAFKIEYGYAILVSGDPMDVAHVKKADCYDEFNYFLYWCGYEGSITMGGEVIPHNRVLIAANRARAARFEHGESGANDMDRLRDELIGYNDKWKEPS